MKRVKAACIFQTLVFSQKPEAGLNKEQMLEMNRREIELYERKLQRFNTRYQIVNRLEQEDGSILVHVRKQYNEKADVMEYFQ